jgi:hypothetical protein
MNQQSGVWLGDGRAAAVGASFAPVYLAGFSHSPVTRIVNSSIPRTSTAALFALSLLVGCSSEARETKSAKSTKTGRPVAPTKIDDSAAGSIDLGTSSYHPRALTSVGSVAGTIKFAGVPPADSVMITKDQQVCGPKTEGPIEATAKGISNAVVWIADVKTGKPLPIEKRVDLGSEDCALDPRVQAVVVGTTVNVENDDRLIHRLVFTRGSDTLTVMPFFNTGQMVASERLAKTRGIVEVHCVQHPWTRGYIAVFEHPYFAVTDRNGSFKIDSLAPGTYTMMVWHEGMSKATAQQVQVAANGTAKVDVAISPVPPSR